MASLRQTVDENSIANDSLNARTVRLVINGTDTVTAVLSPDFTLGFVSAIPDYKVSKKEYGFFESIPAGIAYGCETLAGYVNDLKYVFTKEGSKQVGGFVAIGNIFPSVWDWRSFWTLTALLSIILGFMNVLPIPALDGGHAVFAIYEIVTGRKPSEKFLERAQLVGMIILFGLLIFANMNDILRLIGVY
jgi:regulator of sigma E protease